MYYVKSTTTTNLAALIAPSGCVEVSQREMWSSNQHRTNGCLSGALDKWANDNIAAISSVWFRQEERTAARLSRNYARFSLPLPPHHSILRDYTCVLSGTINPADQSLRPKLFPRDKFGFCIPLKRVVSARCDRACGGSCLCFRLPMRRRWKCFSFQFVPKLKSKRKS